MKKISTLILVGMIMTLSSQTLFKDSYLLGQNIVNSYRFTGVGIPTDGLLAYYPFNGNANDETGNGYDGTLNGVTSTTDRDGNPNSAYIFTSGYVEVGDIDILYGNNYTWSVWINANTVTGIKDIMVKFSASGGGVYLVLVGDAIQVFSGSNTTPTLASSFVQINTWYLITITMTTSSIKLYVNGSFQTEGTTNINLAPNNNKLFFGNNDLPIYANTRYFDGKLDDITIYNRVLTTEELGTLYIAGLMEKYLKLYWLAYE